jgi:serine/threonine protein kinase
VIEHEVEVIRKICGKGAHPHIVAILKFGELLNTSYYFIDMELCDLNLKDFIHSPVSQNPSIPSFVENAPPQLRVLQIWNIMMQIASGLVYMHSLNVVHRDLKPANGTLPHQSVSLLTYIVLYSRRDSVWKLADFGFTSEATSTTLHTSIEAKGTDGYRAPELLGSSKYNNKADIWSLGCILYELAVRQKAFHDDWATFNYKTSGETLAIVFGEDIGDDYKENITRSILIMLQIEFASRPSAADLLQQFTRNFQSIQVQSNSAVQIHQVLPGNDPKLEKRIILGIDLRLLLRNDIHLEPDIGGNAQGYDHAIQMCHNAINKEPLNYWLWHELCRLYAAKNDLKGAIQACELGSGKSVANPSPLIELSNLYAANGEFKAAITTFVKLCNLKPTLIRLALRAAVRYPLESPSSYEFKFKSSLER